MGGCPPVLTGCAADVDTCLPAHLVLSCTSRHRGGRFPAGVSPSLWTFCCCCFSLELCYEFYPLNPSYKGMDYIVSHFTEKIGAMRGEFLRIPTSANLWPPCPAILLSLLLPGWSPGSTPWTPFQNDVAPVVLFSGILALLAWAFSSACMDWVLNFLSLLKKKVSWSHNPLQILLHFHLFFFFFFVNLCAVSSSLFPFYPELSFCFQYSQKLPVTMSLRCSVMKSKIHAQSSLSPALCKIRQSWSSLPPWNIFSLVFQDKSGFPFTSLAVFIFHCSFLFISWLNSGVAQRSVVKSLYCSHLILEWSHSFLGFSYHPYSENSLNVFLSPRIFPVT